MPKFSDLSKFRLSTCHPDLIILFNEVIQHIDCTILEGYRNQTAQDKAFAEGKSKLKYPDGKHNKKPSLAVDAAPYPLPDWKNTGDFYYFGGMVMGIAIMLKQQGFIKHDIKFGGDWSKDKRVSDETFIDNLHFEIILA